MSIASLLRAKARQESINKAVSMACNRLCAFPNSYYRLSTRAALAFLLRYPTLTAHGELYQTAVREVEAGVKEVYLERR